MTAPAPDALVDRLRGLTALEGEHLSGNVLLGVARVVDEAADRIATLTAERDAANKRALRCCKMAEDAEATAAAYKVDAERYRREWHKCRRHLRAANKGAELLSKVCRLHAAEHALRYFRDAAIEAGKK
jgi:hypothetical protein